MPYTLQADGAIQTEGQQPTAYNGSVMAIARTPDVFKPVALASGQAETTIWTPASGKRFRLQRLVLTASAQTVLTFKDNTAGTTILVLELAANAPLQIDLGGIGVFSGAADRVLTVTRATAATLNGFVAGNED
ncbi:MAG TPA: hypothetical protein PKK15_06405 [Kouleothrix sp.]|uniref:hypothetical protein n=1 Tax=Kouleothrix sp. TaxID=2779161 RepID=UPI002CF3369B|nr:hypothetical protein [Kouleothrix sp.]